MIVDGRLWLYAALFKTDGFKSFTSAVGHGIPLWSGSIPMVAVILNEFTSFTTTQPQPLLSNLIPRGKKSGPLGLDNSQINNLVEITPKENIFQDFR